MAAHEMENEREREREREREATDMIPEALGEIGELMFQRVLHDFKHDGEDPSQPDVPEDHCLAPPTEHMGKHELVQSPNNIGDRELTVLGVGFLWQALPEVGVDVSEELSGVFYPLKYH